MSEKASDRRTVEIWLRKHVFSITLDRVAAVRHSKAIKVGDIAISIREADGSSVREAALAKAERLAMMEDLYSGVEVTVEETPCATLKEAYKVTINFHDLDQPGSGTLLLRRMENGTIYDFLSLAAPQARTTTEH